jgi:hypothetical protein
MSFIWHDWTKLAYFMIVASLSGLGLYFFWYRNLKSEVRCLEEDERWAAAEELG